MVLREAEREDMSNVFGFLEDMIWRASVDWGKKEIVDWVYDELRFCLEERRHLEPTEERCCNKCSTEDSHQRD